MVNSSTSETRKPKSIQSQADLASANETFSLLVDAVEDYAIFALDPNGYILTWNAGGIRLKGYKPEEIIGKHFSIFYTPEDLERYHPQHELDIATERGKYEEEGWRIKKDGSRFWASVVITALRDSKGTLRGFGKVTRDLTERKNVEDRLRQSEERFRLMVEGVQDYAIFMLDKSGNVETWNKGAERNKGYLAHEIIGQHFSKFYPESDKQCGKPAFELKEATIQGRFEDEGWRIRKDGSRFWANVIITAVRNANKELVGFSKVTRDLTERKKAEDILRSSFEQLEVRVKQRTSELAEAKNRAEKAVAARDQFFSMASHELKTPLSALKLQTQLRKRSVLAGNLSDFLPENLIELCEDDERQINRLSYLVENMLDISKLTSGTFELKPQEVQLSSLITDVLKVLSTTLSSSGNTCTVTCSNSIVGRWDRTRIEQVFTNLISNCTKYAPRTHIEINAVKLHGEVNIFVKDVGPGIPKEKQHKIFDPFERLNSNQATGLGLGLYIIKQIVEAHKGSIEVESQPGMGTTFKVVLPFSPTNGEA